MMIIKLEIFRIKFIILLDGFSVIIWDVPDVHFLLRGNFNEVQM